jgi:hypothetical protein
MPVQVAPSNHGAKPINSRFSGNALDVLQEVYPALWGQLIKVLQSLFDDDTFSSPILLSENGLVNSIIDAYSQHHQLTLRPEDIWFAVLTQISVYITTHAEELREKFVEHEGQKELKIKSGDRYSIDFGAFTREMTKLIEQNIIDPEYRAWIMRNFLTST